MTQEYKTSIKFETNQQIYDKIHANISLLRQKAEDIRAVHQICEDNERQENILMQFESNLSRIAKNLEEYSLESLTAGNRRELQTTLSLSTAMITSPVLLNKISSLRKAENKEEIIQKSVDLSYR